MPNTTRTSLSRSCLFLLAASHFLFAVGCYGPTNQACNAYCNSITISPKAVTLAAGESFQFKADLAIPVGPVVWKVNGITGGNASVGTITSAGVYTAPAGSFTNSAEKVTAYDPDSDIEDNATVTVLGAHRIGVHQTPSFPGFVDRDTSQPLVPRGNNYIRLAMLTDPKGNAQLGHSTFAAGLYDAQRAETALATMQADGYNVIRVFLEGCCQNTIGDPAGGLRSAYMDNVVDFLKRAQTHAIYVMVTTQWLPAFGGYSSNCPQFPQFNDVNLFNLCGGGVTANVQFWHDFVSALISKGAPLQNILAYELTNEYYYNASAAPLSWTSGTITTANGQTYDMSSATSRQQMMDDGLVYFTEQMRSTILSLDPTALVSMGFFVPQQPNPTRVGDPRIIEVYPAIANSTVDFVDLHAYPLPNDLTLDQMVQNYGFVGYQQQKPVFMGEFGGFKTEYATAADAASGLSAWQAQSCGYHFDGWLVWTWDTDEQPELWNALSSGGLINQRIAPQFKSEPCAP